MKPRRALWGWGGVVLALHALVLMNLPRQTPSLVPPALAHTFSTRMVALPAPAPVPAPVPVPVPTAASRAAQPRSPPAPALRKALAPAASPASRQAARPAVPAAGDAASARSRGADADADTARALPVPDEEGVWVARAAVPAEDGTDGPAPAAENKEAGADTTAPDGEGGTSGGAAPATLPAPGAPATPAAAPHAVSASPAPAGAPALPALAVLAPGADQPQPGPAPAVRVPAPQQLQFDVTGQAKKFHYSARAALLWQHDGQRYQARQEITLLLLGSRTQTSSGTLGPAGLQPLRFGDRTRSEKAAHFDYDQHRVTFSANAPDAPLASGTQDRLSVFVQLGALLAAAPERYPLGTRIQLATAGTGGVDTWTFTVDGEETLNLPLGSLQTLRLQRLPRADHDYDQKAELWLAPTLGYLPARIRLTQANGDFADLQLLSHGPP